MTTLSRVLALVSPKPVPDEELARRVETKMPGGVRASSVEHGCVVLMGAIAPRDRAQLVGRVAKLRGVDAVMDLMTEISPT